MEVKDFEAQKLETAHDKVLQAVTKQMTIAEIKARLTPDYNDRAIEEALADALREDKLVYAKKGVYAPKASTAPTAESAEGQNADGADDADWDYSEPENDEP